MALFKDELPLLSPNAAIDEGLGIETSVGSKVQGSWAEPAWPAATTPVTSTSYTVFIATVPVELVGITAIAATAGGAASTVIPVHDLAGVHAPGSGTNMTSAALALSGTANTSVSGTLATAPGTLQLAKGDKISLTFAGTISPLAGLFVNLWLKRI